VQGRPQVGDNIGKSQVEKFNWLFPFWERSFAKDAQGFGRRLARAKDARSRLLGASSCRNPKKPNDNLAGWLKILVRGRGLVDRIVSQNQGDRLRRSERR
jgi:hypothetical protein